MMEKKKIAILTQPLGHNYGGIMQNYALQQVLLKKGFEVETIAREYPKWNFYSFLYKIKNNTYNRLLGKYKRSAKFSKIEYENIIENMNSFICSNIKISKKLYSTQELSKYFIDNVFDVVLVGSDQTWRKIYSPKITNYYLDFLSKNEHIKKISYASSFGTDDWEYSNSLTKKCKVLAEKFDAISVREESGIELCKKHFGVDALCVLDPTLLLEAKDYVKLFDEKKENKEEIVVYMLDCNNEKRNFISNLAKKLNKNVLFNQPMKWLGSDDGEEIEFKYLAPEAWLQSFYNADFIITDSFHGTVFSILFRKPFLSIINTNRGATRFYSLLDKLGLQSCIVEDMEGFDYNKLKETIDYDTVELKLKELRNSSFSFLDKNLI